MYSKINPLPLYLDKNDVLKLVAYLQGFLDKLDEYSIINISQSNDLNDLNITIYIDGVTPEASVTLN